MFWTNNYCSGYTSQPRYRRHVLYDVASLLYVNYGWRPAVILAGWRPSGWLYYTTAQSVMDQDQATWRPNYNLVRPSCPAITICIDGCYWLIHTAFRQSTN